MKNTFTKRILSAVLAVVTVASLFVLAAPVGVSAGTQSWTKMVTPDAAGLVMPYVAGASALDPATTVTVKGPMAQSFDGSALFVAATVGGVPSILKSTDGGRTWPVVITAAAAVTALAASPSDASVLYYAANPGSPTVYKSTNANTTAPTFVAEANCTLGGATNITALAVSPWNGRYIVVIGTAGTPGNVYYMDESTAYYNFVILGTNDFNASVGGSITSVSSITLSPNYPSDRFTVAIGTTGANTYVGVNQFGGAWGANIANAAGIAGASTTSAAGFTTDFNATTNPNFYFGLGGTANGIYRFAGVLAPGASIAAKLSSTSSGGNGPGSSFTTSIVSLDVTGTWASAGILAGNQAGAIITASGVTVNSAPTFAGKQLNTSANANRVYIMAKNVTANTPVYVLVGGTTTDGTDDTAFWVSAGTTYHALSLIGNTGATTNLVSAPNGELFISMTGANATATTTNDSFTVTAKGIGTADAYTITSAVGAGDVLTLLDTGAGSSVVITVSSGSVVVTGSGTPAGGSPAGTAIAGFPVTVTMTAAQTAILTAGANATVTVGQLSGLPPGATPTDPNGSMAFPGYGIAFNMDMNYTQVTIAGGGALNTLSCVAAPSTIVGNVWTSTAAGQVLIVTATTAGTSTWTLTGSTGAPAVAESNDPNGTQTVSTSGVGHAQDMNLTETVTVAQTGGTLSVSSATTGIVVGTSPGAGGWTLNFTANDQVVTVAYATGVITALTVTGPTGATPTPAVQNTIGGAATAGTLNLIKVADTGSGATLFTLAWGSDFVASAGNFTSVTVTTYPDFLWRNFDGNWERVSSTATGVTMGTIVIDSAYATSKTMFFFNVGTKPIYKSTNNGDSFSSTAWTNTAININTLYIVSGTSLLVGDAAGNIWQSSNSGYSWTGTTLVSTPLGTTVFGAGYTVDQIVNVNATTLLAVAFNGATVQAAQGTIGTTGAVTWTLLAVPAAPLTPATIAGTGAVAHAFIAPAADFGTTGNIFVAVNAAAGTNNGIFRYPSATSATGFVRVDAAGDALGTNGAVGIVAAPGGVAGSGDGSGLVYVPDTSVVGDVARVRGLEVTAEKLDAGVTTALPGNNLRALVLATTTTAGNVTLYALGNNSATTGNSTTNAVIWTYTDQMGKQGDGVVVSNLVTVPSIITFINTSTSNATITFNTMANATDYWVVVAPTGTLGQTSFYTAADAFATQTSLIVGATTGTATYIGMAPNTSYTVNVWAACANDVAANDFVTGAPVTSFRYASSTTSTFITPLAAPTAPVALAPLPGAINVPVNPAFGWNSVMGATSYTLQVSTSPTFATLVGSAISVPTTAYVWTGTALSNNTDYYWRVQANTTGGGVSAWVTSAFTTIPAVVPAVVVTQTSVPAPVITVSIPPVPTIILTQQPGVTVTAGSPITPIITFPGLTVTQLPAETPPTPAYIWLIVGVGALLTLAVIILIIRTRRVV
jgi:hypothetical protein